MYDTEKARVAQDKYLSDHNIPISVPTRCWRCNQNIYAETGHPVEKLPRGKVRLIYSETWNGISVERAGSESINGCPFCHASFDD